MTDTLTFGPHTVELSNLDKLFFPDAGLTKGDVIDYYFRIADTVLPHIAARPITMHRFPDGIAGEDFYQQQISDYFPGWISRATVEKSDGSQITHVVCDNAATLVYLANQACLTPHVWLSRTDKLHHPDRLVIDLDPSGAAQDTIRAAALRVGEALDDLGLTSFVMTSGSAGYHIVLPLDRSLEFDAVRDVAQAFAAALAAREPDRFTTEHRKDRRGDRVFLDTVRNSYGQTSVAPYAIRARASAPVATPLEWDELAREDIRPQHYTVENIFRRLGQKPDPWQNIAQHAQSLDAMRERLDDL